MNDYFASILKNDMRLYRKYDKAEAKYILSLSDNYELVDIDLPNSEEFHSFIRQLAQNDMCFDEWAKIVLTNYINSRKEQHEKISKHTKNMENRTNRKCR